LWISVYAIVIIAVLGVGVYLSKRGVLGMKAIKGTASKLVISAWWLRF